MKKTKPIEAELNEETGTIEQKKNWREKLADKKEEFEENHPTLCCVGRWLGRAALVGGGVVAGALLFGGDGDETELLDSGGKIDDVPFDE